MRSAVFLSFECSLKHAVNVQPKQNHVTPSTHKLASEKVHFCGKSLTN